MAKTLIVAKHSPGPHQNGYDGCHARYGCDGMCPGVGIAEWLNKLGDDTDIHIRAGERTITVGDVRDNWLRESEHIVAVEPALAKLRAEERRYCASLRMVRKEIKRIEKERK